MIISFSNIMRTLKALDLEYSNINKEEAAKVAAALNYNNVLEQIVAER